MRSWRLLSGSKKLHENRAWVKNEGHNPGHDLKFAKMEDPANVSRGKEGPEWKSEISQRVLTPSRPSHAG